MNYWIMVLSAFSSKGGTGDIPREKWCVSCVVVVGVVIKCSFFFWCGKVYMLLFSRGWLSRLFSLNRYILVHIFLVLLFSLFYRLLSVGGYCSLEESLELSSFFNCSYYALITEFTIGALNNPRTFYLRSLVMLQVLLSFLFLNL